MLPFEELRAALAGVRIVHHIRGRIRLKLVTEVAVVDARRRSPKDIDRVLDRMPGVRSVRANFLARSCIVEYDPDVIPEQAWRDFLAGVPSDAAATLERILRDSYQEFAHAEL